MYRVYSEREGNVSTRGGIHTTGSISSVEDSCNLEYGSMNKNYDQKCPLLQHLLLFRTSNFRARRKGKQSYWHSLEKKSNVFIAEVITKKELHCGT